jgi:hypothetical protein
VVPPLPRLALLPLPPAASPLSSPVPLPPTWSLPVTVLPLSVPLSFSCKRLLRSFESKNHFYMTKKNAINPHDIINSSFTPFRIFISSPVPNTQYGSGFWEAR